MKRFSLAILALSMLATPVFAQPGKPAPAPEKPAPTAAAPKKVKTLTIEAMNVGGDRVVGHLGPISVTKASTFTSLINIRRDYIDLIVKEAEQI